MLTLTLISTFVFLSGGEAIAELYKVDGPALAELAATFGYREEGGTAGSLPDMLFESLLAPREPGEPR